jgi:hypothetical protein
VMPVNKVLEISGDCRAGTSGVWRQGRTGLGAHRDNRLDLWERNDSRRLLKHTGDDIFQRFGALSKASSKRQILLRNHPFFVLVIDIVRSSRARARRTTIQIVLLSFAVHHLILVPLFWSLAVRVVRCSWPACGIRHGKLRTSLGKASEGVRP